MNFHPNRFQPEPTLESLHAQIFGYGFNEEPKRDPGRVIPVTEHVRKLDAEKKAKPVQKDWSLQPAVVRTVVKVAPPPPVKIKRQPKGTNPNIWKPCKCGVPIRLRAKQCVTCYHASIRVGLDLCACGKAKHRGACKERA